MRQAGAKLDEGRSSGGGGGSSGEPHHATATVVCSSSDRGGTRLAGGAVEDGVVHAESGDGGIGNTSSNKEVRPLCVFIFLFLFW